jgi:hypothetical protein
VVEASPTKDKETTMTNFAECSKRYHDHNNALAEANVLNKAVVFDALVTAGITRLTIEFDGEGDSGQLNGVAAYMEETSVTLPLVPITLHRSQFNTNNLITCNETLKNAVETLCYDYLEQKHGGWENNDGAYGTFEFDVGNRTIGLEFNERFVDTSTHNHTF